LIQSVWAIKSRFTLNPRRMMPLLKDCKRIAARVNMRRIRFKSPTNIERYPYFNKVFLVNLQKIVSYLRYGICAFSLSVI
jgi:hypothetical protein